MEQFDDSEMVTLYESAHEADREACAVRFDGDVIVVSYQDVVYRGKAIGEGHWRLRSVDPRGEATLHRIAEGLFLEGYWQEDGLQGMWRIELGKAD
ncbi:MAG: hypothetical protein H6725_20515 [Sandaracinaceae bacterium]|nr:hypothetical protein [Sandaracinaceae bacterium]